MAAATSARRTAAAFPDFAARHIRQHPNLTYRPATPTVLVNFGESVNLPLLFGAALSVFGAATLVHLLPVPALLAARSQPRELLRTE